ncbi:hypothetical protein TNCV_4530311 [Trichonephila clavipes]|nr:hypothetical protein TNCV_4530311 [Trichonephila clavipes]
MWLARGFPNLQPGFHFGFFFNTIRQSFGRSYYRNNDRKLGNESFNYCLRRDILGFGYHLSHSTFLRTIPT